MGLFNAQFYNDFLYGESSVDSPKNLKFYRTNVDNRYVFYWGFDTDFLTPNLIPSILRIVDNDNQFIRNNDGDIILAFGDITPYNFELQIDDDILFSNPLKFLNEDALNYQNGVLVKGYEIEVPNRLNKENRTLFARVRTKFSGNSFSTFSNIIEFQTFKHFELDFNEKLLDIIPDENVYNKDILKSPVTIVKKEEIARGTGISDTLANKNVKKIISVVHDEDGTVYFTNVDYTLEDKLSNALFGKITWVTGKGPAIGVKYYVTYEVNDRFTNIYSLIFGMYAKSMDSLKLQSELLKTDIAVDLVRDEQLFENFGTFFDFQKPLELQPIEYRTIIRALINASMVGSTKEAVDLILLAFTGAKPEISLIRDLNESFEDECFIDNPDDTGDDETTCVLRSDGELAHGFNIKVLNPTLQELDIDLIKNLVLKLVPAHTSLSIKE